MQRKDWWASGPEAQRPVQWWLGQISQEDATAEANSQTESGAVFWQDRNQAIHYTYSVPPNAAEHGSIHAKTTSGGIFVLSPETQSKRAIEEAGQSSEATSCSAARCLLSAEASSRQYPGFASTSASVYASGLGDFGAIAQGVLVAAGSPLPIDPAWFGCCHPLAPPPTLQERVNVTNVACGTTHSLFLTSTGALYSCGGNTSGQLGLGSKRGMTLQPTEVPFFLRQRVQHIAAGRAHSLAIVCCEDATETVYAWGSNSAGQCGIGKGAPDTVLVPSPVELAIGSGATSSASSTQLAGVAAGGNTSLAWGQHGELWGWGAHANGQAAVGALEHRDAVPQPVLSSDLLQRQEQVVSASVGTQHSLLVTASGALYVAGSRLYGRCGMGEDGQGGDIFTPLRLLRGMDEDGVGVSLGSVRFVGASAGTTHSLAVDTQGRVWAWGDGEKLPGDEGTLAATGAVRLSSKHVDVPTLVPLHASVGASNGCSPPPDADADAGAGADTDSVPSVPDAPAAAWHVAAVAAGPDHSLALGSDGSVRGWGYSAWVGALPDASAPYLTHTCSHVVHIPLPPSVHISSVAVGAHHSLFVASPQEAALQPGGAHFRELHVLQPPVPGSIRELMCSDMRSNSALVLPLQQCSLLDESPVDARNRLHGQVVQYLAEHGTLRGAFKEEFECIVPSGHLSVSGLDVAVGLAEEPRVAASPPPRAGSAARRGAVQRARSTSRGRAPLRATPSSVETAATPEVLEEGGEGGRRLPPPMSPADSNSNPMMRESTRTAGAAAPRVDTLQGPSKGEEWSERGTEDSASGQWCRWLTCGLCATRQGQVQD